MEKIMKTLSILIHSTFLALANICSILLGFGVFSLLRPTNQILVQAPSAAILSMLAFLLWNMILGQFTISKQIRLQTRTQYVLTYFATLLLSPIIFVPMHYLGRGYLTSFENILVMWYFQMPTNMLALLLTFLLIRNRDEHLGTSA
jgi:drug/metabolite transporter superfamily protein YnfA